MKILFSILSFVLFSACFCQSPTVKQLEEKLFKTLEQNTLKRNDTYKDELAIINLFYKKIVAI